MRTALAVYLAVYYLALAAAVATIWSSGLIQHLHRGWTFAVVVVATALGVALAIASRTAPPDDGGESPSSPSLPPEE